MARQRHRKKNSTRISRTPHEEKLHALSKAGYTPNPFDTRGVNRQYRELKSTEHIIRRANKKSRDEFRKHGYHVNHRGIIVDGPRDSRRVPIPGSKIRILSGGVVSIEVRQRRDFIYGFTDEEKREFAKDPEGMEKSILARLRKRFPNLRRARKPQTRLQWGAYQATKEFAPSYFTAKYFAAVSPEEKRKVGKRRAEPRIDKLTGFHFVVHVKPKKKKGRKKK